MAESDGLDFNLSLPFSTWGRLGRLPFVTQFLQLENGSPGAVVRANT